MKDWHNLNIQKEWNRQDYTYLARLTKARPVYWFNQRAAKVHFNEQQVECPYLDELTVGQSKDVKLRYGVVAYEDLKRDLKYWESLISSSFMMRPHSTLLGEDAELQECQQRNLNSALAFSLLTSPKMLNEEKRVLTEHDLYETIVNIPHFHF